MRCCPMPPPGLVVLSEEAYCRTVFDPSLIIYARTSLVHSTDNGQNLPENKSGFFVPLLRDVEVTPGLCYSALRSVKEVSRVTCLNSGNKCGRNVSQTHYFGFFKKLNENLPSKDDTVMFSPDCI